MTRITKTGSVTITGASVSVQFFHFEESENESDAAIKAMEWAIGRLRQAIEEERHEAEAR